MSNQRKDLSIEELNKEMKDFLYIITHDLKNPVRGIKQSVDWLLEDHKEQLDEEGVKLLEVLQTKSVLLSEMIDALNNYSKLSFKEESLSECSLEDMMDIALENVRKFFIKQGLKYQIKLMKDFEKTIILRVDELDFIQIISDLIKTSINFSEISESNFEFLLKATVVKNGNEYVLSLISENSGINAERINNLFSPFQELTIGAKKINTLMTLAQSKKLIETLGGSLKAELNSRKQLSFLITYPTSIT